MALACIRFLVLSLILTCVLGETESQSAEREQFMRERQAILNDERGRLVGWDVSLTPDEVALNALLMNFKQDEFQRAERGAPFLPAMHFFKARPLIEKSNVFKVIRLMPKGGILHTHGAVLYTTDWLIQNATYRPYCHICIRTDDTVRFTFTTHPPYNPDCTWTPIENHRRGSNASQFDIWLRTKLSLVVPNPEEVYQNSTAAWKHFQTLFGAKYGLYAYAPIMRDYWRNMFLHLRDDNVQYVEDHTGFGQIYELNGTVYSIDETIAIFRGILHEFQQQYPEFFGYRFIRSFYKKRSATSMAAAVASSIALARRYPDMFLGFDLVGEENEMPTLRSFLPQLLQSPLRYYLHAGETNWIGTRIDENLVDALLLGTRRIGHGFALTKHPVLLDLARRRNVAIEVCPVSNQVLGYVSDLRNHPMAILMAQDYPMVISSDDTQLWDGLPLSHDFYAAFMGLAGKHADLRTLKKLAMNSFSFSALPQVEKTNALHGHQAKWQEFVQIALQKIRNGTLQA